MDMNFLSQSFLDLSEKAGRKILSIAQSGYETIAKEDGSPVTSADLAADEIICSGLREILAQICPGDSEPIAVISEENDFGKEAIVDLVKNSGKKRFILVDPLDGTRDFIRGRQEFTVNIALIEQGKPVLGIVHAPALGRSFIGDIAKGAMEKNAKGQYPIHSRMPDKQGWVGVCSRSGQGQKVIPPEIAVTQWNMVSSSLKFCLLACGEADIYPQTGPTREWDSAAGQAVLTAAGGCVVHCPPYHDKPLAYAKKHLLNPAFLAIGAGYGILSPAPKP